MKYKKYLYTIVFRDKENFLHTPIYRRTYKDKGSPKDVLEKILKIYKSNFENKYLEIVSAILEDGKKEGIVAKYICPEIAKRYNLPLDMERDPPGYYYEK